MTMPPTLWSVAALLVGYVQVACDPPGPWGYAVNGQVAWQGENVSDRGTIRVAGNVVQAMREDEP